jgi:hypothetical protein
VWKVKGTSQRMYGSYVWLDRMCSNGWIWAHYRLIVLLHLEHTGLITTLGAVNSPARLACVTRSSHRHQRQDLVDGIQVHKVEAVSQSKSNIVWI